MSGDTGDSPPPTRQARLTAACDRLLSLVADGDVSLSALAEALGRDRLAALLILPCLLVILPIGMVPGVPDISAILMIVIAGEMLLGWRRFWAPRRLTRMVLPGHRIVPMLNRIRPSAAWLDRRFSDRLGWVIGLPPVDIGIAAITLVSALVILIFGIVPGLPALICIPVLLFGLGSALFNGWLVLAGFVLTGACGAAALAWI